ncbi:MAG: cysteine--tRNA ligase, partial [Candidatus Pacearchaeota archaeon]
MGYKVFYVQNITDIAKKISQKALEINKNYFEISSFYTQSFLKDVKALNISSVNKYAITSKYIKEIKNQIKRLLKKRYAYITHEGVLFNSRKYPFFGVLL